MAFESDVGEDCRPHAPIFQGVQGQRRALGLDLFDVNQELCRHAHHVTGLKGEEDVRAEIIGRGQSGARMRLPRLLSTLCLAFLPSAASYQIPLRQWLADNAIAWAASRGLQIASAADEKNPGAPRFVHLPISLLPLPFPKSAFDEAVEVAPVFNLLVDRVSRDNAWLKSTLSEVRGSDPFTGRLLRLHESCQSEGVVQAASLGLHRSDYMLDQGSSQGGGSGKMLQVELNTIASSFGSVASMTAKLHRYLLERFTLEEGRLSEEDKALLSAYLREGGVRGQEAEAPCDTLRRLVTHNPHNPTLRYLPEAISQAHQLYGCKRAVVIFVVQPGERNVVDQRLLELTLWEEHKIQVFRLSLAEIRQRCGVRGGHRALLLDGKDEVSVVYFRAGYSPSDYFGEDEWAARALIERSAAIKCPTLGYQLAGTKKVQQQLCKAGQLERFLEASECKLARRHFTGLYSLGSDMEKDAAAQAAVAEALREPGAFVLKPQREGGGNNLYGQDVATALQTWDKEKLAGHILMQRIFPSALPGYQLRDGSLSQGDTLSEIGVFGTFLGDTSSATPPPVNRYSGYLVRSKFDGVNEGGVATGADLDMMSRANLVRGLALVYIWAQIDAYMLPELRKDQGLSAQGHGRKVDYYKVLHIKPSSNTAAIKKAYRQCAKTTHPDLNANAGQQDFLLVKEAYQVLSNPELRATYDRRRNIGVGFGIAETLAVDFVMPMAKDVAFPMVKDLFNGFSQAMVKDIAEPLAKMAAEQAQRPFRETAAYLNEKRQQVTGPITETVAYLDEKKRQVEHTVEASAAYLEQKRQEIKKPILETIEQGHMFVERSAAFVNQTITEPLVHTMENSAAMFDETTRMVTEPLVSTAAFIDEKKRQVAEPIMHGVEVSSAFLHEAGRQVSEPILHGVEASSAFLQETHNQVAVPIMHSIEVSGAAIKEAQLQVSEPIMHSIEASGAAIKEAKRQVTEPIMHSVEVSSAFLHETQRQVTEPIVSGVQRSTAMMASLKHRLLTGASEFKQLEATRRSEQLRRAEQSTRDFLDQSRALLTSWGMDATSSTRRALGDGTSSPPPSTTKAPIREPAVAASSARRGEGEDMQPAVFGIVTSEGVVRRSSGEACGPQDKQQ